MASTSGTEAPDPAHPRVLHSNKMQHEELLEVEDASGPVQPLHSNVVGRVDPRGAHTSHGEVDQEGSNGGANKQLGRQPLYSAHMQSTPAGDPESGEQRLRRLAAAGGGGSDGAFAVEFSSLQSINNILAKKAFYFQKRYGKIDLHGFRDLDVGAIEQEVNIEALQSHLEELTFGDLERSDDLHPMDEGFLKLFRIAQMTVEYLLSVQDSLADIVESSSASCRRAELKLLRMREKVKERDATISGLKKYARNKQQAIDWYKSKLAGAVRRNEQRGRRGLGNAEDGSVNEQRRQQQQREDEDEEEGKGVKSAAPARAAPTPADDEAGRDIDIWVSSWDGNITYGMRCAPHLTTAELRRKLLQRHRPEGTAAASVPGGASEAFVNLCVNGRVKYQTGELADDVSLHEQRVTTGAHLVLFPSEDAPRAGPLASVAALPVPLGTSDADAHRHEPQQSPGPTVDVIADGGGGGGGEDSTVALDESLKAHAATVEADLRRMEEAQEATQQATLALVDKRLVESDTEIQRKVSDLREQIEDLKAILRTTLAAQQASENTVVVMDDATPIQQVGVLVHPEQEAGPSSHVRRMVKEAETVHSKTEVKEVDGDYSRATEVAVATKEDAEEQAPVQDDGAQNKQGEEQTVQGKEEAQPQQKAGEEEVVEEAEEEEAEEEEEEEEEEKTIEEVDEKAVVVQRADGEQTGNDVDDTSTPVPMAVPQAETPLEAESEPQLAEPAAPQSKVWQSTVMRLWQPLSFKVSSRGGMENPVNHDESQPHVLLEQVASASRNPEAALPEQTTAFRIDQVEWFHLPADENLRSDPGQSKRTAFVLAALELAGLEVGDEVLPELLHNGNSLSSPQEIAELARTLNANTQVHVAVASVDGASFDVHKSAVGNNDGSARPTVSLLVVDDECCLVLPPREVLRRASRRVMYTQGGRVDGKRVVPNEGFFVSIDEGEAEAMPIADDMHALDLARLLLQGKASIRYPVKSNPTKPMSDQQATDLAFAYKATPMKPRQTTETTAVDDIVRKHIREAEDKEALPALGLRLAEDRGALASLTSSMSSVQEMLDELDGASASASSTAPSLGLEEVEARIEKFNALKEGLPGFIQERLRGVEHEVEEALAVKDMEVAQREQGEGVQ